VGGWFRERAIEWDARYCSPLSRARDTAGIISAAVGQPAPVEEADLAEVHAGQMQGKTAAELRRDHPSFYERGLDGLGDYVQFGGESYEDVQQRVGRLVTSLCDRHREGEQRVLVVSHGGLLFQLAKALICVPVPRVTLLRFSNCSVTQLTLRERRGVYMAELEWHLPVDLMGGEVSGGSAGLLY
jgi:broad specificity phosphatase PhoE